MKILSTDTSAVALGVDRKVLDNVLSREGRALLGRGSRGRSRRISIAALERIAIALILNRDLGVSVAKGLQLAEAIISSPIGQAAVGSLGVLAFDLPLLRRTLELAVDDALEAVAPRTRGRPRSDKFATSWRR